MNFDDKQFGQWPTILKLHFWLQNGYYENIFKVDFFEETFFFLT